MELVRSWTEALAYAEGSTKAVWGPLLRLAGGGSLLQDNVIHELLGSFETEAALYQRRRRAATERGGEMRDAAVSTAMVRSGDEWVRRCLAAAKSTDTSRLAEFLRRRCLLVKRVCRIIRQYRKSR